MARTTFQARKRRTRDHVIADQSVNLVERYIIDEGHTAQRVEKDYGYHRFLFTFDEQGYAEPGVVSLQLKAAEKLQVAKADYVFDLDIRDYNLWMLEEWPVMLILFDASQRRAYWLDVHGYFREAPARRPKKGAKSIRVRVSRRQVVSRRATAKWRHLKRQAIWTPQGEES
jgi:hypothetical protein